MSDLISRQDAIDALKEYEVVESDNFTKTDQMTMMTVGTIANCIEAIEELQSAEPERIIKIGQRSGKTLESAIDYLHSVGWLQEHDKILTESAEPERTKGEWQRRKGSDCWECSQCHAVLENDDLGMHNFYFCYHCGANMMNKSGYMDIEEVHYE